MLLIHTYVRAPQLELFRYTKADYERPLEPGEGIRQLRDLFDKNEEDMGEEQADEAVAMAATERMYVQTKTDVHPVWVDTLELLKLYGQSR